MKMTYYKRPHGNTDEIEVKMFSDDEEFFLANSIKLSIEGDGSGNAAILYADIGRVDDDGEPDELILFASFNEPFENAMRKLRKMCEKELT